MPPVLNLDNLHADLKKNIQRPAQLMSQQFSNVNEMLRFVNPYLLTAGKIPLPRLRTERVLKHNRDANKDTFLPDANLVKLDERWLEANEGKVEFALKESEIMALWNSYLFQLAGKTDKEVRDYMTQFPFEEQIYKAISDRAYHDLRNDSWNGIIGVSSASPVNGWLKKIQDALNTEIPAAHIAATDTITESNVVAEFKKVFAKVAAKSYALGMARLQIHCSPQLVWLYNNYKITVKEDYKPIMTADGLQVPNELTNAVFVPEVGLEGSNAIVITTKENLAIGLNTQPGYISFRTQLDEYTIKVMGKVMIDVNFHDGRYLFCNDDLIA